ncbi:MAG: DUF4147 domain-containing protein [Acidimicrobiales bacterium]
MAKRSEQANGVTLLDDAIATSTQWRREMDMDALVAARLSHTPQLGGVDLVALGKASREMASAAERCLGDRVERRLIISEGALHDDSADVLVGEHPVPGEASLAAGRAVVDFLHSPTCANTTIFLVSGGASSLCVVPAAPLTLSDLSELWDATIAAGLNITELNTLRAATSVLSGGAVLRNVHTRDSFALVLVDNAISGASWVASGLTYDHVVSDANLEDLLERAGITTSVLGQRLRDAALARTTIMRTPPTTNHHNIVLAEPSTVLSITRTYATHLGYHVIDLGSQIDLEVNDATAMWARSLARANSIAQPTCVVGVGEVTVRVRGTGLGGRCQEFAWLMMGALAELDREAVFVASSTDGRDFVDGVAGAFATRESLARATALGVDWSQVAEGNDSYHGHRTLGQLLDGGHTGWNLCDLYVAFTR